MCSGYIIQNMLICNQQSAKKKSAIRIYPISAVEFYFLKQPKNKVKKMIKPVK